MDYIHRVGRTARGENKRGKALLFLLPTELAFLRYLKQAKVPLNEYQFPAAKIANVQTQPERLVEKNYFLHRSAVDGFRSYLQAYSSHALKSVFDVAKLDLQRVGRAFGFAQPPRVNLTVGAGLKGDRQQRGARRARPGSGAGYGVAAGDKGRERFAKQRSSLLSGGGGGGGDGDGRQWNR
ncbi:ATP-dependent RNA helicase [Cladochytrium tenue]|nr:ATP-dependent RNA helicase [Cladochytrium tenue]